MLTIRKIGTECRFDGNRWIGPVFASQDAIVCVLRQRYNRSNIIAAGIGGLGGAIGGAIAGAVIGAHKAAGAGVRKLEELPAPWRGPDSPLGRVKPESSVLYLPRAAVDTISKTAWLNNVMLVDAGSSQVTIAHSAFSPGKVRDHLVATGWPVIWRGVDLRTSAQ